MKGKTGSRGGRLCVSRPVGITGCELAAEALGTPLACRGIGHLTSRSHPPVWQQVPGGFGPHNTRAPVLCGPLQRFRAHQAWKRTAGRRSGRTAEPRTLSALSFCASALALRRYFSSRRLASEALTLSLSSSSSSCAVCGAGAAVAGTHALLFAQTVCVRPCLTRSLRLALHRPFAGCSPVALLPWILVLVPSYMGCSPRDRQLQPVTSNH